MLLWSRGGEYFHDLAPALDALSRPQVSRGLALCDYDRDGDLDILMVCLDGGAQLLRNEMQTGHWLEVELRSRLGGDGELRGRGEGATVTVHVGDLQLRRSVTSASYLSQSTATLHFGLGPADTIDGVDVRWLGGEMQRFEGLSVDAIWRLTEGDPVPRRAEAAVSAPPALSERERLMEFWTTQRAAMDAMKKENDCVRAMELFRKALALNPNHEDSRYYLANCLAVQGEIEEALAQLRTLTEINPMSHRAYKQWGVMRAITAESAEQIDAASVALERSLEINPEETGALQVLGEIALLRGEDELADQRFEWVCRTNSRAIGALFLRGYLAWKAGSPEAAAGFLRAAVDARGEDWKPEGAVAEGDVASRMHREVTPLSDHWESWDGSLNPDTAFRSLDAHLRAAP
jgi:tetratricopeptide (TPR) repeat protein